MNSLRRQRQGRIPLTAAETSDKRQLATRRMIRRPKRQSELCAGEGVSEKFPKFCPWVYIAQPCRCDRVEQLGGTEMHNCVQLQQLSVTEKLKSVAPRLKTQINLMISVGPKWRNRSDRESQRGFGSLSLWRIRDSECSSHRVVRIWLDQILCCSMNRVWDKKSIDS